MVLSRHFMQEHQRSLIVSGGLLSAILKGQFYMLLFVGLLTLLQSVLFAVVGEYRLSLLCLLASVSTPGLAPLDSYEVPLRRGLPPFGSRHYRLCRLICLAAAILMLVSIKN